MTVYNAIASERLAEAKRKAPQSKPVRQRQGADERRAYQREWRRANPERVREYRRRQSTGTDYLTQWRKAQRGA